MKKLRRWQVVVGLLALALVLAVGYFLFSSPRPLEIREDVTFITGPRDEDGYLNFEAALFTRMSEGIRPEDNANVLLWQMMGPTPEGGQGMHPDYWHAMGVPAPPAKGNYLKDFPAWEKSQRTPDEAPTDTTELSDLQNRLYSGMWYTEDEPIAKEWLASQAIPLELAHRASLKPKYFNPLIARDPTTGQRSSLIGALLPNVQKLRVSASTLALRARLNIRAKNYDAAWDDMMTLQRISGLMSHSGSLVERLVAIAIHTISAGVMVETIDAANWDRATLQKKLAEWQQLPEWHPLHETLTNERYFCLSVLEELRKSGDAGLVASLTGAGMTGGKTTTTTPWERRSMQRMDWTKIYKKMNTALDEVARIAKLEDRNAQQVEWAKFEIELKVMNARRLKGNLPFLFLPSSDQFGDMLLGLLLPALEKIYQADHRRKSTHENIRTAFALAEYRLDHGQYPETLGELMPKYLKQIPLDPYQPKEPLVYRRTERGFQLYSIGPNLADDGGPRGEKGEGRDIGHDVPLPPIGPKPPPMPEDNE